jgi:hypothetical protein
LRRRDRRTVALGLAAAAAVAAAIVVTVTGRGSAESPAHRSVSAYIEQVDGVEQELSYRLTRMAAAYRGFTSKKPQPRAEADVTAAEKTISALERRVSALEPPPEAIRLHRLLLRLLRAETGVAREVTQLTAFTPRFRSTLARASVASRRLAADLAAARVPAAHAVRGTPKQIAHARAVYRQAAVAAARAQADAVDAYCRRLGAVVSSLRALRPPPVMAPALQAQIGGLVATSRAGRVLAGELRGADLANVPVLSRRFSGAARSAGTVVAQRTEIAAIKAYNARVRTVAAIDSRIHAEVVRLQVATG